MFLSLESSNARKISLERGEREGGGGIKILGTQGWEKLGGRGGDFFFLQAKGGWGGLTLDDTMDIDNVFFGIPLPKTKPVTVGIIYRPPDQTKIDTINIQNILDISVFEE